LTTPGIDDFSTRAWPPCCFSTPAESPLDPRDRGRVDGRVSTRSGVAFPETEPWAFNAGGPTRGSGRIDAGLFFGLTRADPTIGFTAGVTYVFNAFTVP